MSLNKIFVIIDPTSDTQPAFERGLDSARDTGARLHLYTCATAEAAGGSTDIASANAQTELENLVERAQQEGVEAAMELDCGDNWAEQAVSAAVRAGASMILKNSFDHNAVDREKRTTSDWTLLRNSPCPVLLVKNYTDWRHRRILGAINPASTEKAHIELNEQITALAMQFASSHGSDAHFVIAYQDLNHTPDRDKIARDCGISPEHIHLQQGKPADVISDVAQKMEVDLIIVGTVARDGIKGRVVGNTCERLLDRTHSDLLVLNR